MVVCGALGLIVAAGELLVTAGAAAVGFGGGNVSDAERPGEEGGDAAATSGDSSGLATWRSRATTKHKATSNKIVTAPLPITETIPSATAAPISAPITWMNAPLVA